MSNDQTKTALGSPQLSIVHIYSQYSDCIIIFLLVLRLHAGIDLRGQADRASGIVGNLLEIGLAIAKAQRRCTFVVGSSKSTPPNR